MDKRTPETPVLVGHPYIPQGMGEHVRSSFRAFQAAGLPLPIRDVYGFEHKDRDLVTEFEKHLVHELSDRLNIYHMNGDEVDLVSRHMTKETPARSYKIIYPAWELASYPSAWVPYLEMFDEVWAPSQFICDCLQRSITRPVRHMPLACDLHFVSLLGRRYFGIPESAFVFLFMFDLASHIERKNPMAILEAYQRLIRNHAHADGCLVLKVNGAKERPQQYQQLKELCASRPERIVLIDRILSDNEIRNLVRNCDCFVSLHRSEGFGRGLSEAMFLGKPVIATAYSGNLDFMSEDNACLVDYRLIPLKEGDYPYWDGQVWADPDIDQAVGWMAKLMNEPDFGRRLGSAASRHIRCHFSYRATGLRYRQRVDEILSG